MVFPPASRVVRVRSTYVSPCRLSALPEGSWHAATTSGLHNETTLPPPRAQPSEVLVEKRGRRRSRVPVGRTVRRSGCRRHRGGWIGEDGCGIAPARRGRG